MLLVGLRWRCVFIMRLLSLVRFVLRMTKKCQGLSLLWLGARVVVLRISFRFSVVNVVVGEWDLG